MPKLSLLSLFQGSHTALVNVTTAAIPESPICYLLMEGNEPPQVDLTWADSVRLNYMDLQDSVISAARTREGNVHGLLPLSRKILQFRSHLQAVSLFLL